MKKLLLASVAISGLAFAAPAHAEIDLELGGYFIGYGAFVDQDETAGTDVNSFDMVRDTEIHIGGETTLDNGLTVGAHFELQADGADTSVGTQESYVYFSGNWGRVNVGNESGAAYLLQVAAPSADKNVDGIAQYVSPFYTTGGLTAGKLQYAMSAGKDDKITYLSPIMSGFQAGLTFSPDTDLAGDVAVGVESAGVDETYQVAVRYEGEFENVGVIAGAGYSHGDNSSAALTADDAKAWNVGLDLDVAAFGIGAIYTEDNNAANTGDTEIFVLGVDYTTGPFKLGASYYNNDTDNGVEFDRYTVGAVYEYGPGMSFRGALQFLDQDNVAPTADADGTALLLGTQINF